MPFKPLEITKVKNFDWRKNIVYVVFVIIFAFFSIILRGSGFLTVSNFFNILRQTAMITIMGVGMTFVISTGQIDLSVGSITALSAITAAMTLEIGGGVLIATLVGLMTGLLVGLVNGVISTQFKIPPFLVTLGMMQVIRGLAKWITGNAAIPILNQTYNYIFGLGNIGGIPLVFIWTVIIVIVGHIVLRHTPFGVYVLATGGNEEAAKYTGINTNKIKIFSFLISGVLAGFAGVLYSARMQAGRFTFGEGDELTVIAAVILGGTSLFGGKGTIIGTFIGSLIMGTINNGLIIAGLDVSQQMVISGLIIIFAVALGSKKD
jgi:ribose transport system permease protein